MAEKNKATTLKKVLLRVRPYWAGLIVSLLLALVYVVMSLYIPILVGDAIDCIVDRGQVDFASMKTYLVGVALCAGIAGISQWVMSMINNAVTFRVTRDIRNEAFRHIRTAGSRYAGCAHILLRACPSGTSGRGASYLVRDVGPSPDGGQVLCHH